MNGPKLRTGSGGEVGTGDRGTSDAGSGTLDGGKVGVADDGASEFDAGADGDAVGGAEVWPPGDTTFVGEAEVGTPSPPSGSDVWTWTLLASWESELTTGF